uniref:golgin subfamily A member 6-like protein 22 n=1 Tax=Monopterus albus TaxID=43700 RepID=UPI0009B363ED|nr:golgin subfamily A member 6-like protein 22 [Monopterus albus]
MSQQTTPESGGNSKPWGEGSDTMDPGPPGERELKVGAQTSTIKHLLNEFRGLHEQRLRWLELDSTVTREELLQKKVDFLWSYVNDFADQNQVLVQTIEDLQKEADHVVSTWGMKLFTSDHILDVSDVDLRTLLLDELERPVVHILHNSGSLDHNANELEDLEILLQNKDTVISDLETVPREDLQQKQNVLESGERLVHLESELSCLQRIHKDNMKEIAEKDICITKLQANIQMLQQEGADTSAQLSKLNMGVRELQETLNKKEEEWRQREEKQKLKYEREHQNAEERRQRERQKREEDWMKRVEEEKRTAEEWKRGIKEERKAHAQAVKKWAEKAAGLNSEIKEREEHVRQLDQELAGLRTTQDSLKKTLAQKEKHTQQLVQDNTQLKESLATLQSKIKKQEIKMCALVKELAESNKQHSDSQKKLLQSEKDLEKLCEERDELRAKMEDQSRQCVHLNHTREQLEADAARSHEKLHTTHLEVRSRDQLIVQLRAEMKTAEQKHRDTQEQLFATYQQLKAAKEERKDASLQVQEQKETIENLKQKYTAAIEKVHQVQGQVVLLEEELQYSQQQLRESQSTTHSVKEQLAELEKQYQEKVGQWESSQESLDQLTNELQANQNLLRASLQKVDHFTSQVESLQQKVDTLKQQKLMLECDLQLYKQSHSHSDEKYLSLVRHGQQLQKCCTEQVQCLVEREKAILQMKSDLERQTQEKADLKQTLAVSHHTHLMNHSQLEQEVAHLKKEVTRLELEVADAQKAHVALLRQSEEKLKGAQREVVRRCREMDVQRAEMQRLQDKLQEEEEKLRSAIREKQSLSTCIKQLRPELEELHSKHHVTVEELVACAVEAQQMQGCLNERKLAEEQIRSISMRLETEVAELRKSLQQAVDQKLKAEREKQDAQEQVNTLQSEIEGTQSANVNLRHESQLVMTNVSRWITEQKAANESLAAQMKVQNKVLFIVTEEKGHLQEANDTLKAEVKRLKEMVDEKERDVEHFKAQIRDEGIQQDKRIMENQGCVALNLSIIEDMQTRLRSNLEAIGMLNQQLNTLSRENKQLRRRLVEEMSTHR